MQVKGGVYKLCGGEMLVLPNKYVEEIRRLPSTKANAIQAAIDVSTERILIAR